VGCHGAVTVTAMPLNVCGLVVVVLQVTGGVKLKSGSQMIEKLGETVKFMAEQRGFSEIPELFRGAELLPGDMEHLETLCHWSASAQFSRRCHLPRSTSLTEAIQIVTSSDTNTCSSTVCQSAAEILPLNCLHVYKCVNIYV